MTDPEFILDLFSPENVAKKVSMKHDQAREKNTISIAMIKSFPEFRHIVMEFYRRQYRDAICNNGYLMDEWMAEGKVTEIIENKYGRMEEAFELAKRGQIKNIIDTIYLHLKRWQEINYIKYITNFYISPLDTDSQIRLLERYKQRFKNFLPYQIAAKSAAELTAQYEQVFLAHSDVIEMMRARMQSIRTSKNPNISVRYRPRAYGNPFADSDDGDES